THPIEAASIVSQVRRNIAWLADRCNAIVIVAHSQGGAIAHMALQGDTPPKLCLLFTFGSGLKKLEQLKYLLSTGKTYLRSGVFTVFAFPVFSVCLLWLGWFLLRYPGSGDTVNQVPTMLGWLVFSLILLAAGLRDYVREIDSPNIRRWIQRLTKMPFDWV